MPTNKRTNDTRSELEKQREEAESAKQNASHPADTKENQNKRAAKKKRDAQALTIDPKTVSAERKKMPDARSEGQGKKNEPRH